MVVETRGLRAPSVLIVISMLLDLIVLSILALIVWALVDFALEIVGPRVTGRVILGIIVFVTGAFVPFGIVEGIRLAFFRRGR
jgi:hypothetical protein